LRRPERTIISDSPADYWDRSPFNPDRDENGEESSALLLGRAVHHLILGEKNFANAFAIQPTEYVDPKDGKKKWNNNASACRAWHAEQKKAGRDVITGADVETIKGIAKALARDALVQDGIMNGLVEQSLFWKDKKTGIWVKARPDNIPTHGLATGGASVDVADLKTILCVDYFDCQKSIYERGYYQQAALNRQGFREVLNMDVSTFTFMFAEKKRPHSTRPMILKAASMDKGDEANRVALDVMAYCLKEKTWPGRGPARDIVEYVELNQWQIDRIDAQIQRLKDTFALK